MDISSIDFKRIREHNGSRDRAFEELCCQLASVDEATSGSRFYRKGAGADAGVECFSTLPHGPETCWQAKYYWKFDESLERSLNDSIATALKKHPNLTRYIVCIPFNLSDARTGRAKSPLARWTNWCAKWTTQASSEGRALLIDLWSASVLTDRLLRTDGPHLGRLHYWFSVKHLTPAWFQSRFCTTVANLGSRYTAETSIGLPIRQTLFGLARNPETIDQIRSAMHALATSGQKAVKAVDDIAQETASEELKALATSLHDLSRTEDSAQLMSSLSRPIEGLRRKLEELAGRCDTLLSSSLLSAPDVKAPHALLTFVDRVSSMRAEFAEVQWSLVDRNCVLITGEGGVGKSHLLADLVANQLQYDRPAVMLLGQNFVDGNPWSQLVSDLELPSDWKSTDFLGALDAAAQAEGVRALVVIDALNERSGVDIWPARLAGFLKDFESFPNVAVALSCRSTYVDYVIPPVLGSDALPRIEHAGFGAADARAYLRSRNLLLAAVPKPAHELQNPLFLKTCCDFLQSKGATEFPKDLIGVSQVFQFYLDAVVYSIKIRLKLNRRLRVIENAVAEMSEEMARYGIEELDAQRVHEIFEALLPGQAEREKDLLTHLEGEGLLSVDMQRKSSGKAGEIVRFAFQRLSDHMIATILLKECTTAEDARLAFSRANGPSRYLNGPLLQARAGVVEALALLTVERFGMELPDLVDESVWRGLEQAFRASLVWREQSLFNERTLELIESMLGPDAKLPILISVATEPENRYNAEHLHDQLVGLTMPKRDASWSIPLAKAAYDRDCPAWTLIDWAWEYGADTIEEQRASLAATELTWFLTSSFRSLRDRATKALVTLLSPRGVLAISLLKKFWIAVDDDYLRERLVAAIYGAILQGRVDNMDLEQLALAIHSMLYEADALPVNCLIRDHAQGIVEYCRYRNCLPNQVSLERVRPPHFSAWPLEFVPDAVIESFTETYKDRVRIDRIVSSVVSDGDFGRHVVDRQVFLWSPVAIRSASLPSAYDVATQWRDALFIHSSIECSQAVNALFKSAEGVRGQDVEQKTPERRRLNSVEARFKNIVTSEIWEDYRTRAQGWIQTGAIEEDHGIAARFNLGWARRWICKRAHDLGWSARLHGEFDGSSIVSKNRMTYGVERIGKKYQWLALFELRARLADNCAYIGDSWSNDEAEEYEGEVGNGARDIDPSLILKRSTEGRETYVGRACWWSPIAPAVSTRKSYELARWLYGEQDFINDKSCIDVTAPDGREWLVLRTFGRGQYQPVHEFALRGDTWARLGSFVVPKAAFKHKLEQLNGMILKHPESIPIQRIGGRGYYIGEYPWRSHGEADDGWIDEDDELSSLPFAVRPTVVSYLCEHGGNDYSIHGSFEVELPAPWLLKVLGLGALGGGQVNYIDENRTSRFFDPAMIEAGPQAALVDRALFLKKMEEERLVPIWVIAGEKAVICDLRDREKFGGRRSFTSIYWLEDATWKRIDDQEFQPPSKEEARYAYGLGVPKWIVTR